MGEGVAFGDDPSADFGEGVAFGDDPSADFGEEVAFGDDPSAGLGEEVAFGVDASAGLGEEVALGDDESAGLGEGVFFATWPDASKGIAMLAITSAPRKQPPKTQVLMRPNPSRRYRDLRECNENIKWNRWSCQRGMP